MVKGNRKLVIALVVLLILVLFYNIYLFSRLSKIVEVRELDASIIVSDKVGFDLNDTALTFGAVLRGGVSVKEVTIENNFGFPIEIYGYGKGEMQDFVIPFRDKIGKDEEKTVEISARVPEDAEFGEYRGNVVLRLKKDI